jgi:hypothetical protein
MELDDLQNLLSHAGDKNLPGLEGLARKKTISYDPFREIKIRFMWIIVLFVVTSAIFSPFIFDPGKRNLLFEILYFILAIETVISGIGFLRIRGLEKTGMNIKQTLIRRIRNLRSIYRSYVFLNALLYLVFAIILEFNMREQDTGFDGWEKVALPLRFLIYLLFILFQFLQKQRSYQKNYGHYLSSMIKLLNEAGEE